LTLGGGTGGGGEGVLSAAAVKAPTMTVKIRDNSVNLRMKMRSLGNLVQSQQANGTDLSGLGRIGSQTAPPPRSAKMQYKCIRDLAALRTGYLPAIALRLKYMHEFLVKVIFLDRGEAAGTAGAAEVAGEAGAAGVAGEAEAGAARVAWEAWEAGEAGEGAAREAGALPGGGNLAFSACFNAGEAGPDSPHHIAFRVISRYSTQ
jgi:hypothetical protein